VVSQWYDTPVIGGNLYAYGNSYSNTSNLSAIAGGWKEVDCSMKAVYMCREVSESMQLLWRLPAVLKCCSPPACLLSFLVVGSPCAQHCRLTATTIARRACAVPGVSEYYKTKTTNMTFSLNTTKQTWYEAHEMCKRHGGHLASYYSAAEQVEVEQVGFWGWAVAV
jgi:hypothetical protein